MFNSTKNIFLFILLAFVASSCEDTETTEQDNHTDADGMEIVEMMGEEEGLLYSECLGDIVNNFQAGIPSGNEWDLTVHFLNDECEELEHDDDDHEGHDHGDDHDDHSDEPYLVIEIVDGDSNIVAFHTEGHDDHDDDHGDDDHGDEEHCDEITDQTECESSDHCEWHADDMACEESGHDDHDDHDDHEEHGYTFELETLAPGTATFTVTLMHQGHSDYTSAPITIVVE